MSEGTLSWIVLIGFIVLFVAPMFAVRLIEKLRMLWSVLLVLAGSIPVTVAIVVDSGVLVGLGMIPVMVVGLWGWAFVQANNYHFTKKKLNSQFPRIFRDNKNELK
ncbi:hypothetical protein L5G28_03665 [Gordonia sp. HY285]|uniref:hypothetical protein n=1 Tax=Gordonia liuliyuniae TaxID=2911517 RepID=UPI001F24B658|nr:hypothetical protein [Gordonia liuliyuniae]MCF8609261.1 hypothetical protein [Gordonia liuliyuniae]